MTIQVITYSSTSSTEKDKIIFSSLSAPRALDDYEINVIDLSVPSMWTYTGSEVGYIDSNADFVTIHKMVQNKKKSIVIYALPQNHTYRYNTQYTHTNYQKAIKDILQSLGKHAIKKVVYPEGNLPELVYERTLTSVAHLKYDADLYFDTTEDVVTKSDKSEKATTVWLDDNVYATTLKITSNNNALKLFIETLFEKQEREKIPDWMESVIFDDDALQNHKIEQSRAEIEVAKQKISAAENKLKENAKYKSILYTSGNELVDVVFEILEKLFSCDLSAFEDKKKEDFLIKTENCTFIGEIKGVNSNVKFENITQIGVHFGRYLDSIAETGVRETVKQLLIINPFRNKPVNEREPIHKDQIELAVRSGCLIVETNTLLKLYERFCNGEVTTQKCKQVFSARSGLLSLAEFDEDAGDNEPYKI